MIDPGHPFAVGMADLVVSLETSLREGISQPATLTVTYSGPNDCYELPSSATAVTRVSGVVPPSRAASGPPRFTVFEAGVDYQVSGRQVTWLPPPANNGRTHLRPKPNTSVQIEFTILGAPSGLTEFGPESVAGTVLRAVARELALLYGQMDEAYRRGFVDVASGIALDNVVALLGVARRQPTKAQGEVTFTRKRTRSQRTVGAGTRVADAKGRTFVTLADASLAEGVATATVTIEAAEPGPEGNVAAETIVVMPTPPGGIDSVTNAQAVTGGAPGDTDDQLRDRACHALVRSGNGTLDAIKYAILEVHGIESVDVVDHRTDESIPLGEVWVYAPTDSRPQVEEAIDRTRPAGVKVRVKDVTTRWVSGTFYVFPDTTVPRGAADQFQARVVSALSALPVGQPLSLRRLNAEIFTVPGLADVAAATLSHATGDDKPELAPDPLLVNPTEQLRPRPEAIRVVVIESLGVTVLDAAEGDRTVGLTVTLGSAEPITVRSMTLTATVSVEARQTREPLQPWARFPDFTVDLELKDGKAPLSIDPAKLAGFDPKDHDYLFEVTVSAALYPGVQAAPPVTADRCPPAKK